MMRQLGWSAVDDDDPRLLQAAFALLVTLDLAFRIQGGARWDLVSWPVFAVVLLAVVTTATLLLPWDRMPSVALGVLAVLDIAVIGTGRLSPEGSSIAILLLLPALWLGRYGAVRGAVVCFLAVGLFQALPGLVYGELAGANLSRSVLPALVAVGATVAKASAVQAIGRQQRMSDAIFDTVDVGLVLLGRDGTYERMNRRHEDFMRVGYPDGHDGVAGQTGAVFEEDGSTPLARELTPTFRAMTGEEFDDCRLWIGTDPRSRRAISVSARTVRDEQGDFAGAVLAYKDVTDFMGALRVKDEFVASVSHELRTPLTSITGYVQILQERDDLPEQAASQLGVVARNGDRLLRLIGDLLHAAQADASGPQLERRHTDLAVIVRDSVEAASPAAEAAGVVLELTAPPRLPMSADPRRIGQVVDNLLSNAVKYSHRDGRVQVSVALDGDRAQLEVQDGGIGISSADRDRLFTRFFRTRSAAESTIPGVGLGLSITKEIVEAHGGRIEVESVLGTGSVFRVRLPLER
ncbi:MULTISPECIES: ATP-binding protein [unclassified Nocardioides]|uniref:ATP-binding protein n=1 Tax=unclassified Nocardioides TaxID=2615069 RepID=UPI003014FE55